MVSERCSLPYIIMNVLHRKWNTLKICILLGVITAVSLMTINEVDSQESMHEESDHLYTLRVLYESTLTKDDNTPIAPGGCRHPNFCELEKTLTSSRFCKHGGICHFSKDTCNYWCVCTGIYTGLKCQTPLWDALKSPLMTVPDRGEGPNDRTDEDMSHPLKDVSNEAYNETTFGMPDWYSAVDYEHSGDEVSDSQKNDNNVDDLDLRATSNKQINASCDIIEHEQSTCPPVFTCQHGVCISRMVNDDQHGPALEMFCDCDPGWIGDRCELCCDLPCLHGECDVSLDHGKYCVCEWQWTGLLCDELYEPPEPAPRKSPEPCKLIHELSKL